MTLTDAPTDTEVINLVRETLGDVVADAAQKVLDAIGPEGEGGGDRFVLTASNRKNGGYTTVTYKKDKTFEEMMLEVQKDKSSSCDEILEVKVVRRATVTREVETTVEVE